MKINIPKNSYVKGIEISEKEVSVNFETRKKVALLFICLNPGYWPYLTQILKNCRQHFLIQHHVDPFVWTDFTPERGKAERDRFDQLLAEWQPMSMDIINHFLSTMRLMQVFYPQDVGTIMQQVQLRGFQFKQENGQYLIMGSRPFEQADAVFIAEIAKQILLRSHTELEVELSKVTVSETESIVWPAPTLMRYHLFLEQEEKLKGYDYLFYMDADMKMVDRISDEILGSSLTAAPHPGYAIAPKFIPPYEPNKESTAYIDRLGRIVDENGKKRFMPFYAAGGFQGGTSTAFLKAMHTMREKIDEDYDRNYVAVWNDESHWNKYLWDFQQENGDIIFLDPSYVYPDSLIKEYYVPLWGKDYPPKLITLTKPFSLSVQGGADLQKMIQHPTL